MFGFQKKGIKHVKDIESIINNFSRKKSIDWDGFIGEFYQTFKEEIRPILPNKIYKIL